MKYRVNIKRFFYGLLIFNLFISGLIGQDGIQLKKDSRPNFSDRLPEIGATLNVYEESLRGFPPSPISSMTIPLYWTIVDSIDYYLFGGYGAEYRTEKVDGKFPIKVGNIVTKDPQFLTTEGFTLSTTFTEISRFFGDSLICNASYGIKLNENWVCVMRRDKKWDIWGDLLFAPEAIQFTSVDSTCTIDSTSSIWYFVKTE